MHFCYRKILLVNPGADRIFSANEPLNLALLASFIESAGADVEIADQLSGENVIGKARRFKPDIVGITATSTMIEDAFNIAGYFKKKKIATVLGGVHASSFTKDVLSRFDMVVKGEGEHPLLRILSEGLNKGVFMNDKIVNINQMPLPARHLLNNGYYLNVRKKFPQDGNYIFVPPNEPILSVMITRGCPWNCAFCHNAWEGMPFRIYDPDKVVEELTGLKSNYGIKYFIFRDDNIYSNRKKIKEILKKMIAADLNLNWGANARVDCLDEEILELSKKAGCKKLNFGLESGSQKMLDKLHKGVSVETVYKTISNCRKHRIQTSGSFIVGHPDEEATDVRKTIKMIRKLKLNSIGVAIATPFPETEWWRIAEERNLIPDQIDWKRFDFDDIPIKLNRTFSFKELKKIQRTYYLIAFMANPKYLFMILMAIITNPAVLKKRIKSVLGLKQFYFKKPNQ